MIEDFFCKSSHNSMLNWPHIQSCITLQKVMFQMMDMLMELYYLLVSFMLKCAADFLQEISMNYHNNFAMNLIHLLKI